MMRFKQSVLLIVVIIIFNIVSQFTEAKRKQKTRNKLSITLKAEQSEDKKYTNESTSCDVYCAYSTMYYHRSKMSEYLCHQFLTNEILEGMGPNRRTSKPIASKQTSLLDDEGSSGYSVWLNKHNFWDYGYNQNGNDQVDNINKDNDFFQDDGNEYEGGEITGFALPVEEHSGSSGAGQENEEHNNHPIFTSYAESEHKPSKPSKTASWPSPRGKGWYEDGLFEIGLSALAFLAFGSFITNLIINCLLYPNTNGTVIVMNMTTTNTGTGTGAGRRKRSLGDSDQFIIDALNADQLANMALITLDKLEDGRESTRQSKCLHYVLCNNNRINKMLKPTQKIWLPLWSFSLSWMSGRLKDNRLENLRASVLGLGGASCHLLYPDCK